MKATFLLDFSQITIPTKIPGSLISPRDVGALNLNRLSLHGLWQCGRGIFFVNLWLELTTMRMVDKCKLPSANAMPAAFSKCAGCHNFMLSVIASANNSGYEERS